MASAVLCNTRERECSQCIPVSRIHQDADAAGHATAPVTRCVPSPGNGGNPADGPLLPPPVAGLTRADGVPHGALTGGEEHGLRHNPLARAHAR
jgi:hypothetical protein